MTASRIRRSVVELTALLLVAALAVFGVTRAHAAVTGNFEIDGNIAASSALDWSNVPAAQPIGIDPVGNPDESIFFNGSKEADPSGWQVHGSGQPTGKDDIGYQFAYAHKYNKKDYAFFGFERRATNGTTWYVVELNQKGDTVNSHGVAIPQRSTGDIELVITQQGNGDFTVVTSVAVYQNGAYHVVNNGVDGMQNTGLITPIDSNDPVATSNGKIPAGHFAEVAVDLTSLAGLSESCDLLPFKVINARSKTSTADTAEVKDYMTPVPIHEDTDCATLHITKDGPNQNPAPGATFTISPDPRTGSGSAVTVTDGADAGNGNDIADPDGQANGVLNIQAEPGVDYTVTETSPPPGYFLGATTQITHTADTNTTVNFAFTDPLGSVTFYKTDNGEEPAPLCCATFHIVATSGAAKDADYSADITDNGTGDADSTEGTITVDNLLKGGYDITETDPPSGYSLDSSTKSFTIGPGAQNKDVTVESAFKDEPLPENTPVLHLLKTNSPTGTVAPGDEITYTVSWWNTGNAPATQQLVTDALPAQVDYVSNTGSATFDPTTGPSGTLTVGPVDIADGTSALNAAGSFEVTVTVKSGTAGEAVVNTAHLGDLSSTVQNDVEGVSPPPPAGHMRLHKTVSPTGSAEYGDTLTYKLKATAVGTLDEPNAVVSDVVPSGTTYVAGSAGCVGTPCTASFNAAKNKVSWALGAMAAGTSRSVSFKVTIDTPEGDSTGAIPASKVHNIGLVTTDNDPSTPSNKVVTPITEVLGTKIVKHHHTPQTEPSRTPTLPMTGENVLALLGAALILIGAGSAVAIGAAGEPYRRKH
jgi:uncharacterized repeat protein (TIGR01451 family)